MKIKLKKTLNGHISNSSKFEVENLNLYGDELKESLNKYLVEFTVGILDPDVRGKKPDKFIEKLFNGRLGDFSKRYIKLAYDNDKVVGLLIGLPQGEKELYVYSLHITPNYRNMGVGSILLATCINDMYANNINCITLDVHSNNKPAYNLYKKFGFEEFN